LASLVQHLPLHFGATRAGLSQAAAHNDGASDMRRRALGYHLRNLFSGYGDDSHVNRFRDKLNRGIRLHAFHDAGMGVDDNYLTCITALENIREDFVTDASRGSTGPDDSNGSWREYRSE
jgi:hypothetical protein